MLRLVTLLAKTAMAISLQSDIGEYVCNDMEMVGPMNVRADNTVIENVIIYAEPTSANSTKNDYALRITGDNVTIRNVLIVHAANGMGIYAFKSHNLTLENVQVYAYGNEWGAQPCPTRKPFFGYDCSNIKIVKSDDVTINNVQTENGSRGISLIKSSSPKLTNVVAKNPRGQQPAGQCFQLNQSDDGLLENFYCYSDYDVAWNGDSISMWRSSNVVMRNGVVDGNNAPNGICVMYEGSEHGVHGGLIENVEARNC